MKKILKLSLCLLIIISLTGCNKKEENIIIVEKTRVDFNSIGLENFYLPDNIMVENIEESINGNTGKIAFNYSSDEYLYAASKEDNLKDVLNLPNTSKLINSIYTNDVPFEFYTDETGYYSFWQWNDISYGLYRKNLTSNGFTSFSNIAYNLVGIYEISYDIDLITKEIHIDDLRDWLSDNNFLDVEFEFIKSDNIKDGYLVKFNKTGKVNNADHLICYISYDGEDYNLYSNNKSYTGYDEDELVEELNYMNMTFSDNHKEYYSSEYAEGTIFACDYGTMPNSFVLNYSLSLGAYEVDENEFIGLTKEEAENIIKTEKEKNAKISILLEEHKTETYENGKIYNCSLKDNENLFKELVCKIAINN